MKCLLDGEAYDTGLLIAVSYQGSGRLFWWQSSHPKSATEEVKDGVKILGSINNDETLSAQLTKQVREVVNFRERGAPLDPLNAANILSILLTDFFASDVGRKMGVGGLFQLRYHNGEEFVSSVFDIRSLKSKKYGRSYDVSLIQDHAGDFVQVNQGNGTAVALRSLDHHTLVYAGGEKFLY